MWSTGKGVKQTTTEELGLFELDVDLFESVSGGGLAARVACY